MKLKSLFYILFFLIVACSKEETIIAEEYPDSDGDGVENIQEERDGTNPNAPCDYISESQIYSRTSEDWKNLDCDGDGVTNGKELDPDNDGNIGENSTDPRDSCDFKIINQVYSITSNDWRNLDCDGDGVTNGKEMDPDGNNENNNNGTNPFNLCSFNISDQTLPVSEEWALLDCDEDCKNNSQELAQNTDPTDPTDFSGQGNKLKEIIKYNFEKNSPYNGEVGERYIFDQQGRYIRTENKNNNTVFELTYDTNNRLISANDINFEYTNGKISKVSIGSYTKDVIFNENTILTYDGTEPPGLFKEKFILDPSSGKVIQKENYTHYQGNKWDYYIETFTYDPTFENLLYHSRDTGHVYNSTTGEVTSNQGDDPGWSYNYDDVAVNPYHSSISQLYYNFMLQDTLLNDFFGYYGNKYNHFSTKYTTMFYHVAHQGEFGYRYYYNLGCYLDNLKPYVIYDWGFYGDFEAVINFIYE